MLKFPSIDDAKQYGKLHLNPEDIEPAKVNDKLIALCGTDVAYEDDLCCDIETAIDDFIYKINNYVTPDEPPVDYDTTDLISEIRDKIIEFYEKTQNVEFVTSHDEY